VEGKDYTVTYENNIGPGEAQAIVNGIGDHTVQIPLTFTITGKDISNTAVELAADRLTFSGNVRRPDVVTIGGAELKEGEDFTVVYSDPSSENVGVYKVTVKGKGLYKGTATANYSIVPKGTSLKKLTRSVKAVTVEWKKQSQKMAASRISGYQIQLSTDKNFSKNVKKATVAGYKKTSKKISGLKSGKKYYVRIRTYKKTGGTNLYSDWRKVKSVKVR
jgi:hypothetical protein